MALPPADGWKYADPVVIMQYPVVPLMVVIHHVEEANARINREELPQFSDSKPFRDVKRECYLAEAGKIGIITFQTGKEPDL